MTHHLTPTWLVNVIKTDHSNVSKDRELPYPTGGNIKWYSHFGSFLNIYLSWEPSILLRGIYSRVKKTYVHTKACTWTFTAALFAICKNWRKSKCPSTNEWINKLWYIHTMECSSKERNKLLLYTTTRLNLRIIILSERGQTKKSIYCMTLFM